MVTVVMSCQIVANSDEFHRANRDMSCTCKICGQLPNFRTLVQSYFMK